MNGDRRDEDLFDEMRLRRALRLDAAELPPALTSRRSRRSLALTDRRSPPHR